MWHSLHADILELFRDAQRLPVELVRQSWARVEQPRESPEYVRARGRRNYRTRYRPPSHVARCAVCGAEWTHRKPGTRPRYCGTECKVQAAVQRRSGRRRSDAESALQSRACVWCGDAVRRRPRSGRLPVYCTPRCRERAKRWRLTR